MYIKRRWILLFLLVVTGGAIGYIYFQFFSKSEADEVCCKKHYIKVPSVLTITESTPIPILDSSKANQQITYNILNQVQEGLMRLGPNDIPVLGLAESYQVSPDYRTYTFTIRKNAVWSDGKPVTANDFKFAWERALNPVNEYELAYLFYPIRNAEAYSQGKVDEIGVIASDDRHLIIQLSKPDPNFLSLVTLTPFLPMRSDLVEKYGDNYGSSTEPESMLFSGPFRISSFSPQSAKLVKNTSYWNEKDVHLSEIVINVEVDPLKRVELFKSEYMSMAKIDYQHVKTSQEKRKLTISPKAISDYLVMNQDKEFLQNLKVRKAIQLALNKTELSSKLIGESTIAEGLVPPLLKMNNQKTYKADIRISSDIKEAKNLLKMGLTELKSEKPKTLTLVTTDKNLRLISIANVVKNQLEQIGFQVNVKRYSIEQKAEILLKGEYDLSISEWSAEYHDPSIFLWIGHSKVVDNISNFTDAHYDSLLDQASLETNPTKRTQLLQEAERYLIVDKAVVVPLIYVNDLRLQKPYVKNVLYHPFGADYSLKWATYQPPKQVEATK